MTRQSLYRIMTLLILVSILAPSAGASSSRQPVEMPASQPPRHLTLASEQDDPKPPNSGTTNWQELPPKVRAKIDPRILAELNGQVLPAHLGGSADQAEVTPQDARQPLEKTRFLVYLKAQADLESVRAQRFSSRVDRRSAVLNALVSTAQTTQGPVETLLNTRMSAGDVASYQPFYIFNGFAVEGDLETVVELARRDDVERVVANYPKVYYRDDGDAVASRLPAPLNDLGGLEPDNWNIDLVDAERVWDEFGITGQGAVVAIYDTGADWTHPALQPRYRGYSPAGSDHNYHWFETDPFLYAGGDLGPSVTAQPVVYDSHGTHVLGTMVGDGGTPSTQVGMAPGARWIGIVDQLNGWYGDDISTHKAFQWLLAPTDLTGQLSTADPSKAPDVINCSWGIANPADDFLEPDIAALRAAGIAVVFAAGNPGYAEAVEGSIASPGSSPSAITVGATDWGDYVLPFSGRGSSFWEDEKKPEVVAPGEYIKSTVPGGGYEAGFWWSGTSMAAPVVSGLVALLVAADLQDGIRDLDVNDIEGFLTNSALDLGPPGFDDDYGYGRVDAYEAVRWALSAGDLRGTVTDQGTGAPIAGAKVTGSNTATGDTFATATGASGTYSTTVPAGAYDVSVAAWGYVSDTFSGQTVIAGARSVADLSLAPLPTAQLTGQVLSGTTPISGASVYVAAHPATGFTTGANGAYTLTLPVDVHELVVEAWGYRVLHQDVSIAAGGSSQDLSLTPAPSILLVEADRAFGWFYGNPVKNYIGWALDYENYLYDDWEIQDASFNGTQIIPGGGMLYGVPLTTTLRAYDVVIWAHGGGYHPSGGSFYGFGGSPAQINANDELADYLDAGGGLILSGQDIGFWEDGDFDLYDNYVRADLERDGAALEGETTTGAAFLGGLELELTDASLKGYDNGVTYFHPDAVKPQDHSAYPVLDYDNGHGSAVLAVDPCEAPYRMVYVAAGLEAFAPRTGPIPEYAEMLDRSLDWLSGDSSPANEVRVVARPMHQTGTPGSTVSYDVQVANTGAATDTFTLSASGNVWATRIYSGGVELTTTVELPPCGVQDLTAEVEIPAGANAGDTDTLTVTATGNSTASAGVSTAAFPHWEAENDAGSSGDYWMTGAGVGCTPYAIGGVNGTGQSTLAYAGGRWVAKADKPTPFFGSSAGAAVIDDKIYVPGGYTDLHAGDWAPSDVLEIYDPASDTWSTGASMPDVRGGHSVAVAGGKLYVLGGSPVNFFAGIYWEIWEYDPAVDTWTVKGPMPYLMLFGGATSLDDKIYVGGGEWGEDDFYAYDPAAETWTKLASFPDGGRKDPILMGVDGKVYLYGGDGGNWWPPYYTTAFVYDPVNDRWSQIHANSYTHVGGAGAFAGGRLWAFGDQDGSWGTEALALTDSFCISDKTVEQSTVQPGGRVTYTLEIHADVATPLTGTSVVDPIPAGTTWAGFGANAAGASYNAAQNRVEWSGSLSAGSAPLTFTFGVDVDPAGWTAGEAITNTVVFDSGAGQVFTRTTTTRLSFPDPSSTVKQVNVSEALAGDVLTYTVHVQSNSPANDTFTLRDPIPDNAVYVPGSLTYTLGTAGYDPVTDAITWTGTLSASSNVDVTFAVTTATPLPDNTWITNTATISGPFNSVERSAGTLVNSLDLSASTKTADPTSAGPGDVVTYDFFLANSGLLTTTGLLTDPLPAHTAYVPGSLSCGGTCAYDAGLDAVTWSGDIAPSAPVTLTFAVTLADTLIDLTPVTNTATLADGAGTVYELTDVFTARSPDMSASFKQAVPDQVEPGGTVTYTLYVRNLGFVPAPGAARDPLPPELTYVPGSLNCGSGTCGYAASVITWTGTVPALSMVPVQFQATVPAGTAHGDVITNTAIVTDGAWNTAYPVAKVVEIVEPADLWVAKAGPGTAEPGHTLAYTLTYGNNGPYDAYTGAQVVDMLPDGVSYVDASPAGVYSASAGRVTWDVGTLNAGVSGTLVLTTAVDAGIPSLTVLTNMVTISSIQDLELANSTDTLLTVVGSGVNLLNSTKTASPAGVEQGDAVTYTITLANTGNLTASVTLTDPIPAGAVYVPGSGQLDGTSEGLYDDAADRIEWTGQIPPLGTVVLRFQAQITVRGGEMVRNVVTIEDGAGMVFDRQAIVRSTRYDIYMPLVSHSAP